MANWTDFLDPEGPDGAYLPWKKVEPRVGISRTTAWRLQRCGDFPKPYVVSPGRVAYRESEVEAWKASRAHRSAARASLRRRQVEAAASAPPPEPANWTAPVTPEDSPTDPPAPREAPLVRPTQPETRGRGRRPGGNQMMFEF